MESTQAATACNALCDTMPYPEPFSTSSTDPLPADIQQSSAYWDEHVSPDIWACLLPARDFASAPTSSHGRNASFPGGPVARLQSVVSAPPQHHYPFHSPALSQPSVSQSPPNDDPLAIRPYTVPSALLSLPEICFSGCEHERMVGCTEFMKHEDMRKKAVEEVEAATRARKELELREMLESHSRILNAGSTNILLLEREDYLDQGLLACDLQSLTTTTSYAGVPQSGSVDNPYQILLRTIQESGRTYEPAFLPRIPNITKDLRRAKLLGEHGHGEYFDKCNVVVPLSGNLGFMYVCPESKVKAKGDWLEAVAKKGGLEIVLPHGSSSGAMYYGGFEPLCEWFHFTKEVTGNIPQLFSAGAYTHRPGWHNLRLQLFNPDNELRFCILQYKRFNHKYFESLQDLATRTSQKRRLDDVDPSDSNRSRKRKLADGGVA